MCLHFRFHKGGKKTFTIVFSLSHDTHQTIIFYGDSGDNDGDRKRQDYVYGRHRVQGQLAKIKHYLEAMIWWS